MVGGWLQLEWPEGLETWSIARKELISVVMACMLWGNKWRRKVVRVYCDNEAAVEVLQKGYARDGYLMHLLRCVYIIALYEMSLKAIHIPGTSNTVADVISMVAFQSQVPHVAAIAPTEIPPAAISLLIQHCPDQTSVAWSQLRTICSRNRIQPGQGKANTTSFVLRQASLIIQPQRVACSPLIQPVAVTWVKKSYLAAVRYAQICRGLGDPGISMIPQLEYVIKGIKKSSPHTEGFKESVAKNR